MTGAEANRKLAMLGKPHFWIAGWGWCYGNPGVWFGAGKTKHEAYVTWRRGVS